jgi:hypothetical protein
MVSIEDVLKVFTDWLNTAQKKSFSIGQNSAIR